jgi:hypothetical protein
MTKLETILNETNDLPGKDKPPDDKGESQKPPDDKGFIQEIIRRSVKSGDLRIVAQIEILENGNTFLTVFQERKKKKTDV